MKTDSRSLSTKNILLVGSGGREHALAWKLAQSPRLARLWIAPGNAGTAELGSNVLISAEDIPGLVGFARERSIELVIVGPEGPLALGLADALQGAGIRVFGPTCAAAQLETSKSFAKGFMQRHGIPTARYAVFTSHEEAARYLEGIDYPVVIKASGLAAGKGVILPESREEACRVLAEFMVAKSLGAAGQEVVIEERLEGEEISLLAFADGVTVKAMPPAQDHKRLLDGDRGPNTGGMGAYAPAPACPQTLAEKLSRTVLQAAVDGLRAEGIRYQGVLYAGLILTRDGPRVLEFNCRFGDPETQALLPLLESDLIEIAEACTEGALARTSVLWKAGSCACVVLASAGYPAASVSGVPIHGLEARKGNCIVFHAATRREKSGELVSAGGRVLGITAWAGDLPSALRDAQDAINQIGFAGMQYRRDIGARGLRHLQAMRSAYADAGVTIDSGNHAVSLMRDTVRSTYNSAVVAGIGSFGGLYDAAALRSMRRPVLVASTDGIGTKIMIAAQAKRYAPLGVDIVNHCIDDVLVQGGRPLFFLDYFAASCLEPQMVAEIVSGMAGACRAASCALIGGETAEMPGVYQPGEFDVAGTLVGLVEYDQILPRPALQPGDLLLGLRSSGPHTNGYSLLRRVFAQTPLEAVLPGLERPLVDLLLEPHRSYLPLLAPLLDDPTAPVKALAHITGGGLVENLPRILPASLGARIQRGSWPVPALFSIVREMGGVSDEEMARVFNLGIGMVAVIAPESLGCVQQALGEETWVIGELVPGERKVILQ
ncbi:MAG TPA: phosphoribosylamine--glycine ligase [Anaerolineaceae bacterium]|nr:phosphoribosylamine--glycine ligase [Anaerolineaceae bacterium]